MEEKSIIERAKERVKKFAEENEEFLTMLAVGSVVAVEYFFVGRAFERASIVKKFLEQAELAKKLGSPVPFTATMKKTGETAVMMILPK